MRRNRCRWKRMNLTLTILNPPRQNPTCGCVSASKSSKLQLVTAAGSNNDAVAILATITSCNSMDSSVYEIQISLPNCVTTLYAYICFYIHAGQSRKPRMHTYLCIPQYLSDFSLFYRFILVRISAKSTYNTRKLLQTCLCRVQTLCCTQSRLKRGKRYYLLTSCSSRGGSYIYYTCTFACLYFSRGDSSFSTNLV